MTMSEPNVIRMLRHEPLEELGPERALILREVCMVGGLTAYEIVIHNDHGIPQLFGSRGDAESFFDGYLQGVRRASIVALYEQEQKNKRFEYRRVTSTELSGFRESLHKDLDRLLDKIAFDAHGRSRHRLSAVYHHDGSTLTDPTPLRPATLSVSVYLKD